MRAAGTRSLVNVTQPHERAARRRVQRTACARPRTARSKSCMRRGRSPREPHPPESGRGSSRFVVLPVRFHRTRVADAKRAPESRNQPSVGGDHFVESRIDRHWASRRNNSGCWSMNSSTAVRNGERGVGPLLFRNRMNSRTASCSCDVNESMISTMLSAATVPSDPSILRQSGEVGGR
jgi:hypothetical protein